MVENEVDDMKFDEVLSQIRQLHGTQIWLATSLDFTTRHSITAMHEGRTVRMYSDYPQTRLKYAR